MTCSGASALDNAPCPLTEGEHSFYSQQPVCHVASQLFSFDPSNTLSVFYDAQHNRVLHQLKDILYVLDCTKTHPKLKNGYPIRFIKPKCLLMSFSPCGNFLLYVTAPVASTDLCGAPGGPSGTPRDPSTAEEAASSKGSGEASRQELGIVDLFGDECLTTCVPLRGGTVCDELPSVLQAFWAPAGPASGPDARLLLVVITQKNIELFRFVHNGRTLHALNKVAQVSLLAWVLPPSPHRAPSPCLNKDTPEAQQQQAAAAAAAAAAVAGPVVFVVAVGQRTLQPFLLDPKTFSLVRLSKIELNLPLWQALQQRDVHVFSLYGTAYCVHADSYAGRISLRAITGPMQPDTVLDVLAPGELQLLALDNMVVVYHAALDSVLLFDVHQSPVCRDDGTCEGSGGLGSHVSTGPSLWIKAKPAAAKADPSKGVRALTPLVKGTPLAMHPAAAFIGEAEREGAGEAEGDREKEPQASIDGMSDVELQATNLELARFVSPDVVIDGEFGGVYRLSLNISAIMHRLLKEKQSLCAAVQVLQNRSECKAQVLRLSLHALRLETSLSELQPLLFLLNSKYRCAIEQIPLSLLSLSWHQNKQETDSPMAAPAATDQPATAAPAKAPAASETGTAAAAAALSGRTTIPLELLLQSIGLQTVVTERDVVLHVFYPFARQHCNLPANALLLDASFPVSELKRETSGFHDSPEAQILRVRGGPITARASKTTSALPYLLSVAAEYTRTLLMLQIFPHKVLQAFLFDACAFFKRGDVLKQLLQYHLLLDSVDLVERLFVVWQQLAAAAAAGDRSAARDERWLRQACLDAAVRQRDWGTIVSILLSCKQHKDIIPLLRQHGACDFPLNRILRAVATDVDAQKEQPGLLQQLLGHIRAWASEAKARETAGAPPCPSPNLTDCGAWLPGVGQPQQGKTAREGGETTAAETPEKDAQPTTTTPPTKQPQLINAIGEVSKEYNDAPIVEGEEEAARGWATFAETDGVYASP